MMSILTSSSRPSSILTGGAAPTTSTSTRVTVTLFVVVVPGRHLVFKDIVQQTIVNIDIILTLLRIRVLVLRLILLVLQVVLGVGAGGAGTGGAGLLGEPGHPGTLRDPGVEGPGETVSASCPPATPPQQDTL